MEGEETSACSYKYRLSCTGVKFSVGEKMLSLCACSEHVWAHLKRAGHEARQEGEDCQDQQGHHYRCLSSLIPNYTTPVVHREQEDYLRAPPDQD